MATLDRRSFNTGVSAQVQSEVQAIAGRLESVIAQRDAQVAAAMSDFQADGVSDQYAHVEQRWHSAAAEVRQIVELVRTTLARDDESATSANVRARSAVQSIG